MSTTGKMEQRRSRSSRQAQTALFEVAVREQPDLLSEFREELLRRFAGLPADLKTRASWVEVKGLADYAAGMPIRAERVKAKWGAEPEDLASLIEAVTAWVGRWQLDKFKGWLFDFVMVQLRAWDEYPDEPLGYRWLKLEHHVLAEAPPLKFIYTLGIPDEEYHREVWEEQQPRAQTVQGAPITVPNPYEVENSESGRSLRGLKGLDKIRAEYLDTEGAEPDWNPETGERYEDAVKRIEKDFQIRLRKHLKAKKAEYEKAGFANEDKLKLERDAKWAYQRLVLDWTFAHISQENADDSSGENEVGQQVRAFVALTG